MPERKQLVTPGDKLAEGNYIAGENTYKKDNGIYSQMLGLVDFVDNKVFVVPLRGRFIPRVGDLVIGQVTDVSLGGWSVDVNAPYDAVLLVSEVTGKAFSPRVESLTSKLGVGETVIGSVLASDRTRDPLITIRGPGLGRVDDGIVIELTPAKIPRLIGRKGSMISMLKQESGCDVIVGQNGRVLIRGKDPKRVDVVIKAVKMIEEKAHTSGLTDRIKALIEAER